MASSIRPPTARRTVPGLLLVLAAAVGTYFVADAGAQQPANKLNAEILALPPDGQADLLGKAVAPACDGRFAFHMGEAAYDGFPEGTAFWTLRCADLREYVVIIPPDSTGNVKYADCGAFKSYGPMKCFQRFGE